MVMTDGPGIFVGPEPWPELVDAVVSAGCRIETTISEADGIVWFGRDPNELIGQLPPQLRWLQVPDAGIEKWVRPEFIGRDFVLTCASGIYGQQVAEHALALLLASFHGLPDYARDTSWTPRAGEVRQLRGSTILILGGGGIGSALAPLVSGVGAHSIVVTTSGRKIQGSDESAPIGDLHSLLPRADAVVLCLPVTDETKYLVNQRFLHAMKSSAVIINVARGDLVDSDALIQALSEGVIRGAALDVTDPEPLPDNHPLFNSQRVMVTPHVANPAELKKSSFVALVRDNCRRFKSGDPLESVVDVKRGY